MPTGSQLVDHHLALLMADMGPDDCIVVMADHGNDPTIGHSLHTRENVPVLVWQPGLQPAELGVRTTLSDVGATVCDFFGVSKPERQIFPATLTPRGIHMTIDRSGYTYAHEHLHIDLSGFKDNIDCRLDQYALIRDEMKTLMQLGVRNIIEMTNRYMGRNPQFMLDIMRDTGINVVACTGYYQDAFFPEHVATRSVDSSGAGDDR
jgi:arylsulfatase A-like enzyme